MMSPLMEADRAPHLRQAVTPFPVNYLQHHSNIAFRFRGMCGSSVAGENFGDDDFEDNNDFVVMSID